ncbi:MAG: putative NRPS-like protein biosynthetic cluster [Sclerophora amabilis]|nr:MAG: putative NRPS-like protein biosynthetic cluster [Sclerophora amabilis]
MATLQFQEGTKDPPLPVHQRKQLLNNIVDGMANARPRALYAELPISPTSYDAGYRKVTYGALANAINGVAWWLTEKLGPGKGFQTLTYMGPNDIRYNVLILGAVKAGYKVGGSGMTRPLPRLKSLLDCKVLLTSRPALPMVPAIVDAHPLQVLEVPSVEDLLSKTYPHYPFEKTFEKARDEPLVVLHTSGTTALPKPMIYTHDWAASWISLCQRNPPAGFESQDKLPQGGRTMVMLPPFHDGPCQVANRQGQGGNIFASLFDSIANQTAIIYPLAYALPSAQSMVEGLRHTKADTAFLGPPMMEDIGKSPEMLDFIADNLDIIFYGGGDISQAAGDAITSRVKLYNSNGSTEMGSYPAIRPEGEWPVENWKGIMPHPVSGLEFRHQYEDIYEAWMVRNPEPEAEQPVFKVFPNVHEYQTNDLFSPHPSQEGLWTYRGRSDDVIVFATAHKTNPLLMEQHVSNHPEVRAALMAGTGRSHAALLIELTADEVPSVTERGEIIDRLWPSIEEANLSYQNDAKISKSRILFAHPQKPMQRAGKGTVQRGPTMADYAKELDALYAEDI